MLVNHAMDIAHRDTGDDSGKEVEERLERLQAGQESVVSDPEILSGTPVIRGTRAPVYDVSASVTAGIPVERILSA